MLARLSVGTPRMTRHAFRLAVWCLYLGQQPLRSRVEFHDEPNGRTRLEIRQWLPAHLAGPTNQGWIEALEKLDATLLNIQAAGTDAQV
jgi:hypothetical protein